MRLRSLLCVAGAGAALLSIAIGGHYLAPGEGVAVSAGGGTAAPYDAQVSRKRTAVPPVPATTTAAPPVVARGDAAGSRSSPVATARNQYLAATDFADTLEQLSHEPAAAARFVSAHIRETCATWFETIARTGGRERLQEPISGNNREQRERAQSALAMRSPRLLCRNVRADQVTAEAIAADFRAAAEAGDLHARLRLLEDRVRATRKVEIPADDAAGAALVAPLTSAARLDAQDIALLRAAFASADPVAIRAAGPILAGSYRELQIGFGPLDGPIDEVIGLATWEILACRYSSDCGPESSQVLVSCVLQNRCDVANIEDLMRRFLIPGNRVDDVDRLVARFAAAIDSGDWSFLTVVPGASFGPIYRVPIPAQPRQFVLRP